MEPPSLQPSLSIMSKFLQTDLMVFTHSISIPEMFEQVAGIESIIADWLGRNNSYAKIIVNAY